MKVRMGDAHGVTVLGVASEGYALTDAERLAIIRTAAEQVRGRVPLVARV